MTVATDCATDDTHLPVLFAHATRKDWGVGVLAWENIGKRGYLFEDGEERTLASGFYEMMSRVDQPSSDQKVAALRLQRVLSGRARSHSHHATTEVSGPTFYDQITRLRGAYRAGLVDPKWLEEVRGEGANGRTLRHRASLVIDARTQLSAEALDALLNAQQFRQVWEVVVGVMSHSDLVPKPQLKQPKAATGEQLRELALAVRELLHGEGAYEQRFDRIVAALAAYTGEPAHWEIATALSASVNPVDHVCIHPTVFRRQFKIIGSPGTVLAAKPTGAGYSRVLAATRVVAKKLAEQGETPRDLLDVHDFIRITLKPGAKSPPKAPKQRAGSGMPPAGEVAEHAAE